MKPSGIYTFEISVSSLNVVGISKVLGRGRKIQSDYVGLLVFSWKLEEVFLNYIKSTVI